MQVRFLARTLMLLVLSGFAVSGQAQLPEYQFYSPPHLFRYITQMLNERGIYYLPPGIRPSTPSDPKVTVMKMDRIVGGVNIEDSLRHGRTRVEFVDPHGVTLALLEESITPCAGRGYGGRCKEIKIDTELDRAPRRSDPAFSVTERPDGVRYWRYGNETGVTIWRAELNESLSWLIETLDEGKVFVELAIDSPLTRLIMALAESPAVASALPRLHISLLGSGGNPQLRVQGVVSSSFVYGEIVRRAIAAGYYNLKMDVVIDGRLMDDWLL